ncbi:glycosyltransferase family 4 protein [Niastella caeni]|uniref:Glycosyltransferase family 4 protein n=1 Tax=Niastella caeni TaxID=2569763 RepID=A0A4S8HLE2_9BACT|nr:glycosyltransferase family 4 protein [Niastella caeni]
MKIAQIAPLVESVPPKFYGGTERVVAYLTDALVKLGHNVTLFASGDSITKARLVSVTPTSLRLSNCVDQMAGNILQLQEVMDRSHEFDLLHFHTDYLHFPVTRFCNKKTLTTLHGRLDIPELKPLYKKFNDVPVISISNAQRRPLPIANWVATVYHGLPVDLYQPGNGDGDYVVFLGRFSPEKRVDRAIEIAKRANIKIKIAAKVDKADERYFEKEIRHLLDQPHVEYLQEIGEAEKGPLLANAKALLFPIDWPEPFGMVLIEAMACGTPIIAYNHGSVPEIVDHGKTGFIVNSIEKATEALQNIHLISREDCRATFEKRFSNIVMAKNYVRLYERSLLKQPERSFYLTPAYRK